MKLALRSLLSRRVTVSLTVLAMAVSVALLIVIEQVRLGARASFAQTVSGVDLIVGARGSGIPLLLYSVFRLGEPVNNLSWASFERFRNDPATKAAIPLSLGDSHRGFRVLGTDHSYFEHWRYRGDQALRLAAGRRFENLHEAVLGSAVAAQLGYELGERIVIAHGLGVRTLAEHDDQPFTVVGVLAATGTPVDQTVHISLESLEAIHVDWQSGTYLPGRNQAQRDYNAIDLRPRSITAFTLSFNARRDALRMQRAIQTYRQEPLSAILPQVTLQQLWAQFAVAEAALRVTAGFVVFGGLISMLVVLLSTLNERRREMAILRAVGAPPRTVFLLLMGEALLLVLCAIALGLALAYSVLFVAAPILETRLGLALQFGWPSRQELLTLAAITVAAVGVAIIPAFAAYRRSLSDGLSIRV